MGKIILITGGARSGKSKKAIAFAKSWGEKVVFLATAAGRDKEMEKRIRFHRKKRPLSWQTVEEEIDVEGVAAEIKKETDGVIIDCLTFWVNNLIQVGLSDRMIESRVRGVIKLLKKAHFPTVIVTNEVGAGVVPATPLGRRFRDLAGAVNQMVSRAADGVYLMVSGIALKVK